MIEGIDGAGKRTFANGLTAALTAAGASVTGIAFPRYGMDVHADLIKDALHGAMGDVVDSVHGMALLYALDRLAARPALLGLLAGFDIVLADRYVASNAAYGAARAHQDASGAFVDWVRELEIERFELPVPHAHLLMRVPVAVAAVRVEYRENTESDRRRDAFESDNGLQARCAIAYEQLAAADWLAPWHVLDGTSPPDLAELAGTLLR